MTFGVIFVVSPVALRFCLFLWAFAILFIGFKETSTLCGELGDLLPFYVGV